jgi:hypothetical protein
MAEFAAAAGFEQWVNSQDNLYADKTIPPSVLLVYLDTIGFPNNEVSEKIVRKCLGEIGRSSGLRSTSEFVDLFIPRFRQEVSEIAVARRKGDDSVHLEGDKKKSASSHSNRIPNPSQNTENKPVVGDMCGMRKVQSDAWESNETLNHAWAPLDASTIFNVRGGGYIVDGMKVKSAYSMYEPVGVEIFEAEEGMPFPGDMFYPGTVPESPSTCGVPNRLIVSMVFPNFPAENPIWGKKRDNGPSHVVVFFYELSKRAKAELTGEEPISNGVKLVQRYLSEQDPLHDRTKTIVQLANTKEVDVGMVGNALLHNYNGKPFLSNRSHCLKFSKDVVQIAMNIHTFGNTARSYYYDMHQYMKSWIMDVALVVEGRNATELPEQILACCRLIRPDAGRLSKTTA